MVPDQACLQATPATSETMLIATNSTITVLRWLQLTVVAGGWLVVLPIFAHERVETGFRCRSRLWRP